MRMYKLKVFSGDANPKLAADIAGHLGIKLAKATVRSLGVSETRVEIEENVRGMDVFIVQPTCCSVDHSLMALLIMIDAVRRASADRITAVMPYYGYARQNSKERSRAPITAKLVANLVTAAGAKRILAMDLHAGQIQGFFDVPVDNLFASKVLLPYLAEHYSAKIVMVAPHTGGGDMAKAYAKRLNTSLAIIDKRKTGPGKPNILKIIGYVKGKTAIVISDMIDTAVTITEATEVLLKRGATEVIACATHAVLTEPAVERIKKSELKKVIVTDTIPLSQEASDSGKFEVISVSEILAKAIRQIYRNDPVSLLFD